MGIKSNYLDISYPKVSVITCVYNGEKYISKLLDSVLNMDYPNIEHIIVNDGSTDNTEKIVKKYMKLYSAKKESKLYIKYIKQNNGGLGEATNTGLCNVTGDFWTWINCDDWYEKNAFFEPIMYLVHNRKIDYIQLNGFDVYDDLTNKTIIIDGSNKMAFYCKEKLIKQYFFNHPDFRWLLYICRTDSYRKICPSMKIYPSRYTQDDQLISQIFGVMNGGFLEKPVWNFLHRGDSFLFQYGLEHANEMKNIREDSIQLLDVDLRLKKTLILLNNELNYINTMKSIAVKHKPLTLLRFYFKQKREKTGLYKGFKKCFDHKFLLYFIYSLIWFL